MPGRQQGYALTEVLIAAAIAAGILTATASVFSGVVRLNAQSSDKVSATLAAKKIAARLYSGMSDEKILSGLEGWELERARYYAGDDRNPSAIFELVIATHEPSRFRAEFLDRKSSEGG